MASSFSKRYGDLFIFGEYQESERVDLVFSSHSKEFTVSAIEKGDAEKLIDAWNEMQRAAEKLQEKA